MDQKQVYIKNFGCKVNLADAHRLAYEFEGLGYQLAQSPSDAHVMILNSCSVTQRAEKDARYFLRKFHRQNPTALKVVTGCYAQINSYDLANLKEVDYVVSNQDKPKLAQFIDSQYKSPSDSAGTETKHPSSKVMTGSELIPAEKWQHFKSSAHHFGPQSSTKTRAFIKIQDGCNDFCSYCQIPFARGASRSVPRDQILDQIGQLRDSQTKEVVITGIHLGEWGKDLPGSYGFVDLLKQIIEISKGSCRIRLSSLEPSEFKEPLAEFIRSHKTHFCAHMHFPLQSGSQRILKLMRRRYTPEQYQNTVELAREALGEHMHISADVMVGFPSETQEDFQQTLDLIDHAQLNSLHVFSYSKRTHTTAAKMSDHLPPEIIKQRSQVLRTLSDQQLCAYTRQFLGSSLQVLWESQYDRSGRILGKSSEYLKVCAPAHEVKPNTITISKAAGLVGSHLLYACKHSLYPDALAH